MMRAARASGLWAAEAALLAIHEGQPGTPLPAGFPARSNLLRAHYTAIEDVRGADVEELVASVGLTVHQAARVIGSIP
jgi:hypothetical protein